MKAELVSPITAFTGSVIGVIIGPLIQHRFSSRSEAKKVLDTYRGPLLEAVSALGDRIGNIERNDFLFFIEEHHPRGKEAKVSTAYRVAQFLGYREIVRTRVQILRFEKSKDTRLVASLLRDIDWLLSNDKIEPDEDALWIDVQRGIGELMRWDGDGSVGRVLGYASFSEEYARDGSQLATRLEPVMRMMLRPQQQNNERRQLIQFALMGLVYVLDEEDAHKERPWIRSARSDFAQFKPSNIGWEPMATHVREALGKRASRTRARH